MKDDDLLMYEAYVKNLLTEAPPLELGSDTWGLSDDERDVKRSFPLLSDNAIDRIVEYVISLFPKDKGGTPKELDIGEEHERKGKKSVSMWLRGQIVQFVAGDRGTAETGTYESSTNVTYNSRIIANAMLEDAHGEPFIKITERGASVDVDQVEDVKGDIKADMANPPDTDIEEPQEEVNPKFNRYTEYNVDPLAAEALPRQHKDIAEYLPERDGYNGDEILDYLKMKMIFTNPAPAGGFDSSVPKLIKVLNDLVTAGILSPVSQPEKEGTGKHTSTFDATDSESQAKADRDYIDSTVKQANWGSQTPVMRPDDF